MDNRVARIVKLTSIVNPNIAAYIVQGELMRNLLDSVFQNRQAVYTVEPVATKEFIEEFKELFVGAKTEKEDIPYQPARWKDDTSMLKMIMLEHKILDMDKKVEYLDRVIDKSTFPELVLAAKEIKAEIQGDKL